jgi:dephospho-CoA kinase
VVVVTGGIASGKSAVCERLAALGVEVVDADIAAREVVAPGQVALAEIVAAFGSGVLAEDGALDRRRMREQVFADVARRRQLEAIVHPRVRAWMRERLARAGGTYAVAAIPLYAESGNAYDWVDRVVVVDVPESVQRARLAARDGADAALADAMLAAQATRAARLALADEVVVNDGTLADLDVAVAALHLRLLAWAGAAS